MYGRDSRRSEVVCKDRIPVVGSLMDESERGKREELETTLAVSGLCLPLATHLLGALQNRPCRKHVS